MDDEGGIYNSHPNIGADEDGNFVVVWEQDYQTVCFQRFSNSGTCQGDIYTIGSENYEKEFSQPSLAMADSGNFIISWICQDYPLRHIYVQRFSSNGEHIEDILQVSDEADSSYYLISPSIAANQNGKFVITWNDYRNENSDIYAQLYTGGASPMGANFRVTDDDDEATQNYPAVAIAAEGNFAITWEDQRDGNPDIYLQRYSSNGNPLGGNLRVNDDTDDARQCYPKISMDADGKFVISWEDYRSGYGDVYGQRFLSNGTRIGSNFRATIGGDKNQLSPDVVFINNRIINTWQDNRIEGAGYDIWANVLDWNDPYSEPHQIPTAALLHQNNPNPFHTFTTIFYSIPEPGFVSLKVYDLLGREVQALTGEYHEAEDYAVDFDAGNLPCGIYFIKLQGAGFVKTKKMLMMR